ncbi:NAD(P)H-hydrate epimerase, partial [Acinetobacter sp.]|uniref:NAD(P)H-hydrate epimerase n=1 Tax=Acinetobacter sp. TaxID=472 RepID=UPI0028A67041
MQQQVYHSRDLQAWEQRWFQKQNSSYGLMQQVAWGISQRLITLFSQQKIKKIGVCCGQGNNAGDGYLVAKYLKQAGFSVDIYAVELGNSKDLASAVQEAKQAGLQPYSHFNFQSEYEVYIDALFGIGLNRQLDSDWQNVI